MEFFTPPTTTSVVHSASFDILMTSNLTNGITVNDLLSPDPSGEGRIPEGKQSSLKYKVRVGDHEVHLATEDGLHSTLASRHQITKFHNRDLSESSTSGVLHRGTVGQRKLILLEQFLTVRHELAHAIVCHALGVWVKEISVEQGMLEADCDTEEARHYLGICWYDKTVQTKIDGRLADRALSAHEHAMIIAAGVMGEAISSGRDPMRSWDARTAKLKQLWDCYRVPSDYTDAMNLLRAACDPWWQARSAYRAAAMDAWKILSRPEAVDAMEQLFPILLEQGYLSGFDLQEPLGKAFDLEENVLRRTWRSAID